MQCWLAEIEQLRKDLNACRGQLAGSEAAADLLQVRTNIRSTKLFVLAYASARSAGTHRHLHMSILQQTESDFITRQQVKLPASSKDHCLVCVVSVT